MDKTVRGFLDKIDLKYKTVAIALSGGADSIATAYALNLFRRDYGYALTALHVNHHLRGASSDSDEALVRGFCEDKNIPLVVKHVNITQKPHESLEQAARNARYKSFAEVAATTGTDYIATAHNADDNAETILLNLIRGTGLKGLCGIPPVRPLWSRGNGSGSADCGGIGDVKTMLLRPILGVTKSEVITYCNVNGIAYATDETNADCAYTRNKLRRDVFPLLREINPAFTRAASRCSDTMRRYEAYFEAETARARELCSITADGGLTDGAKRTCGVYDATLAGRLDRLILERLVSGIIYDAFVSPQERHITEIADKIIQGVEFKLNITKNVFFISKKGEIYVKYIKQQYRS
ncbi:hypothetical protein FACS1894133_1330 [Clostridia bacterium]|nr:hypothetical protein FACS1894133_1330 [Clostridia bacterium]